MPFSPYSLILDKDICEKFCNNAFKEHPGAKCIVYDDANCTDKEFGLALSSGQSRSFAKDTKFSNYIESVSVKTECLLMAWKGKHIFNLKCFIVYIVRHISYKRHTCERYINEFKI